MIDSAFCSTWLHRSRHASMCIFGVKGASWAAFRDPTTHQGSLAFTGYTNFEQ